MTHSPDRGHYGSQTNTRTVTVLPESTCVPDSSTVAVPASGFGDSPLWLRSARSQQEFILPANKTNELCDKNLRGRAALMRRSELRSTETTLKRIFHR